MNSTLNLHLAMFLLAGTSLVLTPRGALAADVCDELLPKTHSARWAVAPLDCAAGLESACSEIVHRVINCVRGAGVEIISPGGLTATIDERALRSVISAGDMSELRKVGTLVPASFLLVGELSKREGGSIAVLRLVRLEDGRIVSGTRLTLTDKGELEQRLAEQKQKVDSGEANEKSVQVGIRLLADRLVEACKALSGGARYNRFAILDFAPNGQRVAEQGLGRLVAAELTTRLLREHGLSIVERSRLNQVLGEIMLGQQGVLDEAKAPELGRLAGASAVILGSVSEQGAEYIVHAQVVEVESSTTVVAESVALEAAGLITLASDALVLRTRGGAVYRSLLLPGWGQLYNRETNKSVAFTSAAGVLALAAVATQALAAKADDDYGDAGPGADFDELALKRDNYAVARNVVLIGLGLTWAYNVFDAWLNGVTFDSAVGVTPAGASSGAGMVP